MSAVGLNSCRSQKAKKAPRYFLIPTSRFELEYSVKAEKLDHSLDLGFKSLQYDLACVFWKTAQNAEKGSDSRTVDKIDIRHLDFGMDQRVVPKRSDLLLKLGRPARIEARPEDFESYGSPISVRIKKSFHRLTTYIRTCGESKWGTPEIDLGVSLP